MAGFDAISNAIDDMSHATRFAHCRRLMRHAVGRRSRAPTQRTTAQVNLVTWVRARSTTAPGSLHSEMRILRRSLGSSCLTAVWGRVRVTTMTTTGLTYSSGGRTKIQAVLYSEEWNKMHRLTQTNIFISVIKSAFVFTIRRKASPSRSARNSTPPPQYASL